jgi:hypothetical protein
MRAVLVASLLPHTFAVAGVPAERHIISGVVVNSAGAGAGEAYVAAVPTGDSGVAGSVNWIRADGSGRFQITLKRGRYVIRAKDEGHGYPDPTFLISRDPKSNFPEIEVRNHDLVGIRVVLGIEGGVLQIHVRDDATLEGVQGAKVVIRDADNEEAFVEVNADQMGHLQFSVPNRPLIISAYAPGYLRTVFQNNGQLILSGGEQRSITIDIKRR